MKHQERWALAEGLCRRIVEKYAGQVVVGGVYGSTARGTDTEWSDLEMFFVVRDGCEAQGQRFYYRGTIAGYRVYERSKLEDIVQNPGLQWPFHMGLLSVLHVLHGDPKQVEAWLEMGKVVPGAKFRKLLEEVLPDMVGESFGRIMSCRERGNRRDATHAAIEVLYEMHKVLCLLNRKWVTHDYYAGFEEAFDFPKLPEGFVELVPALWEAREIEEIVPLAERLVGNYWRLIEAEDLRIANYQNVESVPL
jgi:kanamycin nucleotidyltransferase